MHFNRTILKKFLDNHNVVYHILTDNDFDGLPIGSGHMGGHCTKTHNWNDYRSGLPEKEEQSNKGQAIIQKKEITL